MNWKTIIKTDEGAVWWIHSHLNKNLVARRIQTEIKQDRYGMRAVICRGCKTRWLFKDIPK
jgi:hypothetical protein